MESLADVGLVTVQRFKLLEEVKPLESVTSQIQEWPTNLFRAQFDRFELWAVNLGLFVMGHGSLDYRIRDSESMRESIYKMIQNLNRSLDEVLDYVNGNTDQGDEDSDTDSELESDTDLLLGSIKDPIDRLYKLAVWIRNPATRLASSKARNFKQIDEYSNIDLFDSYKNHDYDYVSSLFLEYEKHRSMQESTPVECKEKAPASGDGEVDSSDHVWEPIRGVMSLYKDKISKGAESYLVQRIARANGRRRQQFAYWKKHKDKLREHASSFVEAPTRQLTDEEHIINGYIGETKTPLSVTTATQLRLAQAAGQDILEKEGVLKLDVSEYAPSAWNPSKDTVSFPPPPKISTSDSFFECPYCFTICPISLLSEKAWRAHIIRDLRPYVCTYEQCLNSEQLYDTRDDWIQHEMSTHQRVFRCFEHEEEVFTTLAAYEGHVQACHKHNAVSAKFATSAMKNVHRSCPVCSVALGSMQKLQSHIALHLERFAMFSLPRHTSDSEESEIDSNAFTDHSENEESFHTDLDLESNVADESRDIRRRARTITWSGPSVLTEDRSSDEEGLEHEAQMQRLAARMKAPDSAKRSRQSRRTRVVYDDGTYRYDDSLEQARDGTHPQLESMVPSIHSDFELTESTPPVSEALLPIYSQLLALKQNLFRVRNTGGVSPVRELFPYKMKLNSIDKQRVDGKFVVNGDVPEGQDRVSELLDECFDLSHDLGIEAEDATAETPRQSVSSAERAQEDAHLQEKPQIPPFPADHYDDDELENRDGVSTAEGSNLLEVVDTAIASGEFPQTKDIRILMRPLTKLPGYGLTDLGSDNCQWLALRAEGPASAKVLAVAQTAKDIKFSVRMSGSAEEDLSRPPLWCELYYDPASDGVIFLNKSDVPILLGQISDSAAASTPSERHVINPGVAKTLRPGSFRIEVRDVAVLDFRVLEKRPIAIHEPLPSPVVPGLEESDDPLELRPPMVRKKSGELAQPALQDHKRPSSMAPNPQDARDVSSDSHSEHVQHFPSDIQPLPASVESDAGPKPGHMRSPTERAEDWTGVDEARLARIIRESKEPIEEEVVTFGYMWRTLNNDVEREIELENQDAHGGSEALDLARKMEIERLEVEALKDQFDKETLSGLKIERARELSTKIRSWDLGYVQEAIKDIQANREKREAKRELEKLEAEHKAAADKLDRKAAAFREAKRKANEATGKGGAEPAPIKFKDAVGRKFSFPFHLCNTWPGMEELIKQAFLHVDVLGPHVQEGHYDLIGPEGEIILPVVWDKIIEPGWTITMTMWPLDKATPGWTGGTRPPPPPGWIPPLPRGPPGISPNIKIVNAAPQKKKKSRSSSSKQNTSLLSFISGNAPAKKKRPKRKSDKDDPGSPPSRPDNRSDGDAENSDAGNSDAERADAANGAVINAASKQLDEIRDEFRLKLLPLCLAYIDAPPKDPKKREEEYRKLSETVIQQVLLKLDGIETEGIHEIRQKRKELVRDTQEVLKRLDTAKASSEAKSADTAGMFKKEAEKEEVDDGERAARVQLEELAQANADFWSSMPNKLMDKADERRKDEEVQGKEATIEDAVRHREEGAQHTCSYPGCDESFGTKTHLQRHIYATHARHEKRKRFHCSITGCDYSMAGGKPFLRKDNWKRHMIQIHNIDQQSLPEPIEVELAVDRS